MNECLFFFIVLVILVVVNAIGRDVGVASLLFAVLNYESSEISRGVMI